MTKLSLIVCLLKSNAVIFSFFIANIFSPISTENGHSWPFHNDIGHYKGNFELSDACRTNHEHRGNRRNDTEQKPHTIFPRIFANQSILGILSHLLYLQVRLKGSVMIPSTICHQSQPLPLTGQKVEKLKLTPQKGFFFSSTEYCFGFLIK